MTVLVGLRCVDGAVLACDSQETRVNYFRFWPKVNLIGDRFATMYAGSPTLGEAFFRRLSVRLKSVERGGLDKVRACQLIEEVLLSLAQELGRRLWRAGRC